MGRGGHQCDIIGQTDNLKLFRGHVKVGIIGAGIVGGAIEHWFADAHELFIHDPVRGTTLAGVTDHVDMAYIAVPTPMSDGGSCNLSIVESVLDDLPDGFTAVIKSTVVPGTT